MLVVKKLPANAGDIRDMDSFPGLGGSPGRGNGNPLQYSCLENSVNREAWWALVRGRKELYTTEDILHTYIQMEGVQWMPHTRNMK